MAINRYTQPMQMPMVQMPWDKIWESYRQMDTNQAATLAMGQQIAGGVYEKNYNRDQLWHDQKMEKYDKSLENLTSANILLSNIPHIEDDAPIVNQYRSSIVKQISENVDKYSNNPFALNSMAAAIAGNIKQNVETGDLSKVRYRWDLSRELDTLAEKLYASGDHDMYSYAAAKEAAKHAKGSPKKPDIEAELDKDINFNTVLGTVDPNRVGEYVMSEVQRRYGWYLKMMPEKDRENFMTSIVGTRVLREMGKQAQKRASGAGQGVNLGEIRQMTNIYDPSGFNSSPNYYSLDEKALDAADNDLKRNFLQYPIYNMTTGQIVDPKDLEEKMAAAKKDGKALTFGYLPAGQHTASTQGTSSDRNPVEFTEGYLFTLSGTGEGDTYLAGRGQYVSREEQARNLDMSQILKYSYSPGLPTTSWQSGFGDEVVLTEAGNSVILMDKTNNRTYSTKVNSFDKETAYNAAQKAYESYFNTRMKQIRR